MTKADLFIEVYIRCDDIFNDINLQLLIVSYVTSYVIRTDLYPWFGAYVILILT